MKEDGTIDRASDHNKTIMPDTLKPKMGLGFMSLFHFLLLYFLCQLAHIEEKCYLVQDCNWCTFKRQIVHCLYHMKATQNRPTHTSQQCFKFQQRTKERERQSHICSWRFRKQHFCKASFFLVCLLPCLLARLLVFFCFKFTLLGSVSPSFTQNTPRGVTIESGSNLSEYLSTDSLILAHINNTKTMSAF